MKVLFNRKFLDHNVGSTGEGDYRIRSFVDKYEDVVADGRQYFDLVHPEEYVKYVKEACFKNDIVAEVQLSPGTYKAAGLAVGLTVQAALDNDFAIVRPPGHHAGRNIPSGFCLFNNIAIATQHIVNNGKKVMIIDIDGHHGDGTQSIFYETDQVLYCSIHQAYAFPFSGFPDETGSGSGVGYTLNIPLPAGSGDKEFLKSIDTIISKGIEFKPDHVGVSAGFDGYFKDIILNLNYSKKAYYECAFRIRQAFENVFAVLEGGYHEDIQECTETFASGINDAE